MAEIDLPVLRNADPVEENLTENAKNNILPARYTSQNEEATEVFERVAKNVALAELLHTGKEFNITPSDIKDHPRRDQIIEDVFWEGAQNEETAEVPLDEDNIKYLDYDKIVPFLKTDGRFEESIEAVTQKKEEFQDLMERLAFMPNSPTLMNAGDELQQLSACFVISPDDDIYDIHDTAREAAEVFQSGGGMGYGFWTLRPKGEKVGSTGGIASGPITFMRTFDQMCETIAQGGARRGAQMGVMKIDHPDVIEFIHAKRKDVSLAETLRLNDPDDFTHNSFEGALEEAREILDSGEVPNYLRNAMEGHLSNFNISVGVTDDFMEAVKNDELFTMRHPSTGEVFEANEETVKMYELYGYGDYVEVGETVEIPAREIWRDITEGAHENGEPGVVFIDRFNQEHSFPVDLDEPLQDQEYSMLATNPCVTGDTKVATADGRGAVEIQNLVDEDEVPVYTRKDSDAQVGLAKNIRKTREDAKLVEIETDGEANLTLTPDHPVWTRNRGWVDAGDLEKGDSLHILYETDHNSGYRNVQWTGSSKWNLEHRMVAEDILKMNIDNMNVHHKNSDKQDNRPENLGLIDPAEHGSLHSRDIEGENNPLQVLKERGEFEEYMDRSSFYDTAGENNPMAGEKADVECRECGGTFKRITHTHLEKSHDMTNDEYREKYPNAPMVKNKEVSNHKVVSVESAGTADVYDLEVPGTRNFYASQEGGEYINIHNCGEQPLMEYEACNLGHINLSTIVSHDLHNWGEFKSLPKHEGKSLEDKVSAFLDVAIDWNEFNHRIDVGTNFLDNVVTMSDFPVPEIEESVRQNRKIGLGIMGLAQLYIQLGVEYGSEVANEIGRQLMTHINHGSKAKSHELALDRGPFENYTDSKYADPTSYPEWFNHHTGMDAAEWSEGFVVRNHNTTTVAPTGTTSMIGNTSGGCEPIYSVANFKNVSGDIQGDDMLVQFDSLFLRTLEENDIDIDEVKQEATEILQADEWEGPEQLESVPDELSELFVTTGDLTALEHGAVQCAIQEGVDSAISKTVNAPNDASLEDAETAFEYVYDNGGKGVTYYRDGTRSKQVLTTSSTTGGEAGEEDSKSSEEIAREYLESEYGMSLSEVVESPQTGVSEENMVGGTRERPNTLEGQTYRVETGYGRMYVTVNDLEGEPFEILATIGKSGGQMESMLEGICRMVSASFRSGMNTEEVIEQLRGIRSPKVGYDNGEQVQSIPDGIAKVLVRHTGKKPWLQSDTADSIQKSDGGTEVAEPTSKNLEKPDETDQLSKNVRPESDGDECPKCHKMTLKMTEGCKTCETCGWSAC